ncbi:MAG: PilW family protein [Bacillota bacterium]
MLNKIVNKKGVTLIELVLVLALISLVLSGIYSMFIFGNSTFKGGSDQFDLQNDIRFALESLTNDLRYATKLEIIHLTEEEKIDYKVLTDGIYEKIDNPYETYVFYDSNSSSVVKLSRETTINYAVKSDDASVLSFSNTSADRLKYELKGIYDISNKEFDVNSEILLLNIMTGSSGIIDSSGYDDGNAIKYVSTSDYTSELQYPVVKTVGVNTDTEVEISLDKYFKIEDWYIEPGASNNSLTDGNVVFTPSDNTTITQTMRIDFKDLGGKPDQFVDGDTVNLVLTYGGSETNDYVAYYSLLYIGGGTKHWVIQ